MASRPRTVSSPPVPVSAGMPASQDLVWDGANWNCGGNPMPPPCRPEPPGCPPWFNPPAGQAPWYPGANGGVSFSQVAPVNPVRGHFWWDGTTLWLFDGVSWVDTTTGATTTNGTFTAGSVNTGEIRVIPPSGKDAIISLTRPDSTKNCVINGDLNGVFRWTVLLGADVENGSNSGSDFYIIRYADIGSPIDTPFSISRATGVCTFTQPIVNPSDIALKSNIETISDALSKVMGLTGVRYNQEGSDRKQIGLIAQDVKPHVPEVVFDIQDGKMGISYPQLTALLIEAIKSLVGRVAALEKAES